MTITGTGYNDGVSAQPFIVTNTRLKRVHGRAAVPIRREELPRLRTAVQRHQGALFHADGQRHRH